MRSNRRCIASPTSTPCSAKGRSGSRAKRRSTGSTSRAGRSSGLDDDGRADRVANADARRLAGAARRAADSSPAPTTASPPSIPRRAASRSRATPKKTFPTTASTTARSTAAAAFGPAPWTTRAAGHGHPLPCRPGPGLHGDRRRLQDHQRPGVQPRRRHHVPQRFGRQVTYAFDSMPTAARQPPHLPPIRPGRRLSRRHDRRCRRLPVDRLLGRLVRSPLLARRRMARDHQDAGRAADQLRVRRARPRPALRHFGEHRASTKRPCRCNQMPGGCLCSIQG